jgi:translation initiation factor IF-2
MNRQEVYKTLKETKAAQKKVKDDALEAKKEEGMKQHTQKRIEEHQKALAAKALDDLKKAAVAEEAAQRKAVQDARLKQHEEERQRVREAWLASESARKQAEDEAAEWKAHEERLLAAEQIRKKTLEESWAKVKANAEAMQDAENKIPMHPKFKLFSRKAKNFVMDSEEDPRKTLELLDSDEFRLECERLARLQK